MLYSNHLDRYQKQVTRMFDQIMHLKVLQQQTSEKNVSLEHQVVKLEANVGQLCHQFRQKNVREADLKLKSAKLHTKTQQS